MAENESLDLGKARRWHRVLTAIRNNKHPNQVASLAGLCLRQTVRSLRKPQYEGGPPQLPIADLINAFGDPCEVKRIVRRCHGHDFSLLYHDSIIGSTTKENAIESFLSAVCEKYFDQIEMHTVKADGEHTFARVRSQIEQVQAHLRPDIKKIAKQLSENPNHLLRQTRSREVNEMGINTESLLGESLLRLKR